MYVKQGKEGRWSHVLSDAYTPENLTWNPLEEEIPFLEVIIFRFDVEQSEVYRFCLGFSSAQVPGAKQLPGIKLQGSGQWMASQKNKNQKKTTASTPWFLCFLGWLIFFQDFRVH